MQTRSSTSATGRSGHDRRRWGTLHRAGRQARRVDCPTPTTRATARRRTSTTQNQAAVPNSAQRLLMRDGALLDQTTRSCCAKAPASTIWPRLPCRDRGGGPMSALPTAANGAIGAISATTPHGRAAAPRSLPALVRCCPTSSTAASRSSRRSGHRCVGCSRSSSCSCPGVPAFQAAREDLDAPGRTIIVDPDPLEVRVESAALVPTMERLPVCPNTDALPHE
jgi:hypothetical protein